MSTKDSIFAVGAVSEGGNSTGAGAQAKCVGAHFSVERRCPECGSAFQATREWSRFCSKRCRQLSWEKEHPRAPLLVIAEQPETPLTRRNEGKAKAASNHAHDLAVARELALEMLSARGVGTISDLREYSAAKGIELPWGLNWTGSVFLPPGKGEPPWFEATGRRRNSRHKRGGGRLVREYRLSFAGRSAVDRKG